MAKSSKKKSNSRNSRKKEKNVNKKVTKKNDNKNKYVLNDADIEVIKAKTNNLIQQLEKRSKNPFLFRKKPLIKKQITDLQNWLNEKQFYLLDAELKAFENLERDEKQKLEQENQNEVKEGKEVKKVHKIKSFADFMNAFKNFGAWPLYSRIKRINQNYTGHDRTKRIIVVVSIFIILLAVALIGLLLVVKVIPYDIGGDQQRIGPLVCLVIPLVCMIFV